MNIPKEIRPALLLSGLAILILILVIFTSATGHTVYIHQDYIGQAGTKFLRIADVPMPHIILGCIGFLWILSLLSSISDKENTMWYFTIAIFGSVSYLWFFTRNWV